MNPQIKQFIEGLIKLMKETDCYLYIDCDNYGEIYLDIQWNHDPFFFSIGSDRMDINPKHLQKLLTEYEASNQ
jgi:hypothetical protein